MKNFKEFFKDYEDGIFTCSDKTLAYAAYCQGYAEGMKENLINMLSAPITILSEDEIKAAVLNAMAIWQKEAEKVEEK